LGIADGYDNKFLTLPVCEDDGKVAGIVERDGRSPHVVLTAGGRVQSNGRSDDISEYNSTAPSKISAT
jgi:hypothetical protein